MSHIIDPVKGGYNPLTQSSGIMQIHSRIKKNAPMKEISEHISNKIYPKAKVKFDLPKGW